ncbi:MAG: IS91 family transposase, partial [Actinobacteria bacterium]|nr:IS91 family transposase [Actinomycetota bacterium]
MSRWFAITCRGKRKKQGIGQYGYVIEQDDDNKSCSKSWARLIKKIYEVDPLTCPKCGGSMRIIAFIEDYKVIKKILDWLSIDEFKRDKPPPKRFAVADSF